MDQQLRETATEEEAPSPAREEAASAADVMRSMARTAKGLRMYLENNPVLIRFIEELTGKIAQHIDRFGEFRLNVERFALRYRGTDVYLNQDPKESIAFRLYADGIRSLLFREGITQQELVDFLNIVGYERPHQQDDDIVTRLWEVSLPHIDYLLQDDYVEVAWTYEQEEGVSQQEAISRIYSFVEQNSPLPPRVISKHLLMLTGDEAGWLRQAMQAEGLRNPLDDVVHILSAVLVGGREPALFREFSGIMTNLACDMFLVGEVHQALQMVRFLDKLSRHTGIAPEEQRQVRELLSGILCERTVQVLQQIIDSSDRVSHDDLRELLMILGLPSLGGICELLGRLEKLKMRKVIIEVMVELGRNDPAVFAPFLSDPRWYLVRNVVLVLSLIGSPAALKMIIGLISHKEMRIRKEVLGYLERSPDPKAKPYILKFLRDDSSALRVKALQLLARERQAFALKSIVALTTAEDFKGREVTEKRAVYEAIGELGSDSVLPLFREMLIRKSWFNRNIDREAAYCAAAGLLKVGTTAASELLKEARKQQGPEVRRILDQAAASLQSRSTGQAALPEDE
jgi:hypothetical protein